MSEPGQLILYTTLGCTLCEKAKAEIWPLLEPFQLRLVEMDIAEDEDLLARFAVKIPLVGLGDPQDVCGWPFDRAQLAEWLRQRL
jgi:hypothetical protein